MQLVSDVVHCLRALLQLLLVFLLLLLERLLFELQLSVDRDILGLLKGQVLEQLLILSLQTVDFLLLLQQLELELLDLQVCLLVAPFLVSLQLLELADLVLEHLAILLVGHLDGLILGAGVVAVLLYRALRQELLLPLVDHVLQCLAVLR